MLTPTLREEDSEIWITANPGSSADPLSQRFIKPFERELLKHGYYEDDLHLIIKANYDQNPFFPDVLNKERLYDKQHLSTAEYNHSWLGDYNDTVAGAIIDVDWFNAAIDAHEKIGFKPRGIRQAAFDPSDEGGDPKGYVFRHGAIVYRAEDLDSGDANEGADWAIDCALTDSADAFVWDCDGLGISLKRQILSGLEENRVNCVQFKGSHAVEFPDQIYNPYGDDNRRKSKTYRQTFKNKRAQYYWTLRDRFYNTYLAVEKNIYTDPDSLISLNSDTIKDMDALRAEVCRIPKKKNNIGLIQIMSKPDMLLIHEIPSPNIADSLMMAFSHVNTSAEKFGDINFATLWE